MDIRPMSNLPESIPYDKPVQDSKKEGDQEPVDDSVVVSSVPDQGVKKKWTFLLYGAGDNNLSKFIHNNVDDMEKVGSDQNTHLVSQLDLSKGNCKRYYVTKDTEKGLHSPVLSDMGPSVNMADPKTLTDFIVWGAQNFPSDYIGLSIGDHGGGTAGAIADDRDGGYGMMKPQVMAQAIRDAEQQLGKKLNVIGFDACLMANTEVAYELKDVADYLVASEETEGGYGWQYNKVLSEEAVRALQQALKRKINIPPKEFAMKIVSDASSNQGDLPTMSTIDLSRMNDVAQKMDTFSQSILGTTASMSAIKKAAKKAQGFTEFKDIYDFAKRVVDSPKIDDENLKNAAKDVMSSLKNDENTGAIIAEQHSSRYPGAHGLQIELSTWGSPSGAYKELAWAKDTHWDEALDKISKAALDPEDKDPEDNYPGGGWPGDFDFPGYWERS